MLPDVDDAAGSVAWLAERQPIVIKRSGDGDRWIVMTHGFDIDQENEWIVSGATIVEALCAAVQRAEALSLPVTIPDPDEDDPPDEDATPEFEDAATADVAGAIRATSDV